MGLETLAGGAAVLAAWMIVHPPQIGSRGTLIGGLVVLLFVSFLPPLTLRSKLYWLSPAVLYSFMTALSLGLGAIAWFDRPAHALPELTQSLVAQALFAVSTGLACYWLGFFVGSSNRERSAPPKIRPSWLAPIWLLVLAYSAGLILKVVLLNVGAFGYQSVLGLDPSLSGWVQWVMVGSGITTVVLVISGVQFFGGFSRAHGLLLTCLTGIELAFGFASGYKGNVLTPVFLLLLVYAYYREQLPKRVLFVSATIFVLVLIPANLLHREELSTGTGVSGVAAQTSGAVAASLRLPLEERLSILGQWSSVRFRNLDSVALILQKTPTPYPYLEGKYYVIAPAATFVPRVLWPAKPTFDLGLQFSRTYRRLPPSIRTSTPITHVGGLYMNFGWLGIMAGMTLLGIASSLLFKWFRRKQTVVSLVVYLMALKVLLEVEGDFSTLIVNGVREVGFAAVVSVFIVGSSRHIASESRLPIGPAAALSGNSSGAHDKRP